ncbi:MAG: CRISPR-associated protein Cas4 [Chloroflexi bacterium]|nr:CRISPR-associated protein Cas4 [Chloroflexota bacterium]
MPEDEEILISAIEHYSYCPRQCALIHVEQTFDENQFTIRGRQAHERVEQGDESVREGVRTVRDIPLWSARLGLRGKADLVEFRPEGPYPVEYKVGRRHGPHADLQLCAQALCLEEMLGVGVPKGAIFSRAVRRRHEVRFDQKLRDQTEAAVHAIRRMILAQEVPPAPNDARCPNCSLINACLPGVVGEPARLWGLQGALFRVEPASRLDVTHGSGDGEDEEDGGA